MRTIDSVIETINNQNFVKKQKRYTNKLAGSLACIAHIPEGKQLVCIIGNGNENDNIEALTIWIDKELKNCTLDQCSHLDYLYARLLQNLGDHDLIG
ncbi:MAG: hypothetical protein QM504_01030 [Pseudomonadota bacterium]